MANLIRDQVTTLDIQLFLGNAFTLQLTVLGTSPMPSTVNSQAFIRMGGDALESDLQPAVSVTGRVIELTYPASLDYPALGYQEIRFDERKVIAGALIGSRQTTNRSAGQSVSIAVQPIAQIALSVAYAPYEPGQTRYVNNTLEYFDGLLWKPIPTGPITPPKTGLPYTIPFVVGGTGPTGNDGSSPNQPVQLAVPYVLPFTVN
ncbi:hypothetical protein [Spirosoma sp.]|uniref:hypothetical protein n=1 Tax=Spirosoma sp. TaxID=1899569 RepID=UPI003B3B5EA7